MSDDYTSVYQVVGERRCKAIDSHNCRNLQRVEIGYDAEVAELQLEVARLKKLLMEREERWEIHVHDMEQWHNASYRKIKEDYEELKKDFEKSYGGDPEYEHLKKENETLRKRNEDLGRLLNQAEVNKYAQRFQVPMHVRDHRPGYQKGGTGDPDEQGDKQ